MIDDFNDYPDRRFTSGNILTPHDIIQGLTKLGLEESKPVLAHASLSAFGKVQGGANTIINALTKYLEHVMMPTFTYRSMVIPETGPIDNALSYGTGREQNKLAEFFHPNMRSDRTMGVIAEALRQLPRSQRSMHPILSFAGINVDSILFEQKLQDPLGTIRALAEQDGWILLLGVDQTTNTSIHYVEKLAGRRQFTRWALTYQGIWECPGFPGCSMGFNKAAYALSKIIRNVHIGSALVQAFPLQTMIEILFDILKKNRLAFLCDDPDCERCVSSAVM
ncbi:MAG: AAC(3) family N-acetyltransferase [Anaerolineaceae bacterium]|nr:AAC(3) family N-acetyltransferase [Anaerolineaceae bacterium]